MPKQRPLTPKTPGKPHGLTAASDPPFDRPILKAALYHRVSTLDQDPELARTELRMGAAARGLTVGLEVEETGSGASNSRPGLQQVLKAALRGQVRAVLCWKLDRFGRSALDVLSNIQSLTDAGVRFICTSQGLDVKPTGDPMSRLILGVLASVAEFERDLIRERTRLGMAAARARGVHVGRPRAEGGPDGALVRSLRASGESWRAIGLALGCHPSLAARRALDAA